MLAAHADMTVPMHGRRTRWPRLIGIVSIAIGACLMGAAALLIWNHVNAPAAYRYELGAVVAKEDLGALAGLAERQVVVRRATITAAGGQPLAELELAEAPSGPVLLQWKSRVDDPFLTVTTPAQDLSALAQVLERHLPKDAQVLAWWDTSRQLQLLGGTPVRFAEHLGCPCSCRSTGSRRAQA